VDININSYIPMTNVEGPNTRFCIWVQGCSIRCKGCANFHMWNSADGTIYDVEDMVELIASYKEKIEGITFLGGEPLEQIEAVTYISKKVQELGLTVLVFTGYDYQEISSRQDVKELIKHIDMLIDGKYDETQRDFSRAWVGSSNQNYYFFSDKYDESVITKFKNKIELRIDKNNKISFNGMGNFEELMKAI
jgi:anaerobic ribonucleoside-triphosphate reductase activating protein